MTSKRVSCRTKTQQEAPSLNSELKTVVFSQASDYIDEVRKEGPRGPKGLKGVGGRPGLCSVM